jgi:hypothetical protein
MGFTRAQAQTYEHQVKLGRTLVVVRARGRQDEVINILKEAGAIEVNGDTGGAVS